MNHPRAATTADPTGSTVVVQHPTLGTVRGFQQPGGDWSVVWADSSWEGDPATIGQVQQLADGSYGASALNQSAVFARIKRAVYWVADRHAEVIIQGEPQ